MAGQSLGDVCVRGLEFVKWHRGQCKPHTPPCVTFSAQEPSLIPPEGQLSQLRPIKRDEHLQAYVGMPRYPPEGKFHT